ncbi:hypothetical protein IF1G_10712 [Cordyceps javanica]|uniref:Uncharacterized protein n=1 Tax=Cordyceps javanica TaxID=43265 RepID=A0A545UM80_9HYPO|nr:hypothetical protein IF1G_10712 [Cordyceps javanica]TQW02010.1 hypothetical protein IF2G_10410 [Cordyceps javanica]
MSINSSISAGAQLSSAFVIGRIEATLEGVVDALANAGEIKIPFASRRQRSRPGNREQSVVKFPGSSSVEARKFGEHSIPPQELCSSVQLGYS